MCSIEIARRLKKFTLWANCKNHNDVAATTQSMALRQKGTRVILAQERPNDSPGGRRQVGLL